MTRKLQAQLIMELVNKISSLQFVAAVRVEVMMVLRRCTILKFVSFAMMSRGIASLCLVVIVLLVMCVLRGYFMKRIGSALFVEESLAKLEDYLIPDDKRLCAHNIPFLQKVIVN